MMLYTRRPRLPPAPTSVPSSSPHIHPHHAKSNKSSTSTPSTLSKTGFVKPAAAIPQRSRTSSKHAESKTDPSLTVTVKPVRSTSSSPSPTVDVDMSKRKASRESNGSSLSPSSPPRTTTGLTRPPTPSSPVQIPKQSNRTRHHESAHALKREHSGHRRKGPRDVLASDVLSPSMVALLAVTDIPRRRLSQKKGLRADTPLTVDEVINGQRQLSEKELSLTFSRGSPMDLLLSPPDSFDDEIASIGSAMTRTISADSIPSLGDSFVTDIVSSMESPRSPSPSARRRMASPMRKTLEPVRSPSDTTDEHPLAVNAVDLDELDFVSLQDAEVADTDSSSSRPFKPLRAVFKSNLTASLRALRSAARSFSSINFPSIPPDDFLTRSILTMDPKVPYADERRPPVTEEVPSAEMRRYLNPTTRLCMETHSTSLPTPGTFSASIQMQTYKIQRSRSAGSSTRSPYPSISPQSGSAVSSNDSAPPPNAASTKPMPAPTMRQREVRENPDFIRIAVMEMAMRRGGKLDNSRPGRARWALPPRKPSTKPYEVGSNGVPARWIPLSY